MPDSDGRDLVPALIDGVYETPPWARFLNRLVAQTGARHGCLEIGGVLCGPVRIDAAGHAARGPAPDTAQLASLGLPRRELRAGRVYALDEMLAYDDRARLAAQRAGLAAMRIGHARWLRVGGADCEATLLLTRERDDFSGNAVGLLGALAPQLAAALRGHAALGEARLRASLAETTLGRLGIGQIAFDAQARVLAIDPALARVVTLVPDRAVRRLNVHPDAARAIEAACAALAVDPTAPARVVRLGSAEPVDLLLRAAGAEVAAPVAVIGSVRDAVAGDARAVVGVLAARHALSRNEAALAYALAQGEPLVAAGARLNSARRQRATIPSGSMPRPGRPGRPILCDLC